MAKVQGLAARTAALRMLDAVLRRGETLDLAEGQFAKGLTPSDRGLARAIASESLRWLVDLDALIDGATKDNLAALPEFKDRLAKTGSGEPYVVSPEELTARIKSDYEKYGKLIRSIGMKVE